MAPGSCSPRSPGLRGLFVASDLMAVGAIGALREAGRRVPEDVAVVGFDNSAAATMVEPALTTMRNPIEQTALEALRILDDQIAGRRRRPVHVLLSQRTGRARFGLTLPPEEAPPPVNLTPVRPFPSAIKSILVARVSTDPKMWARAKNWP